MKPRLFLNWSLLAVLLASCAPAPVTLGPVPTENSAETTTPVVDSVNGNPTAVVLDIATAMPLIFADTPTPPAIATSRGPNLEATDPTTVSLASGGIQFVEFFRFT